jgi:hypothetical protein
MTAAASLLLLSTLASSSPVPSDAAPDASVSLQAGSGQTRPDPTPAPPDPPHRLGIGGAMSVGSRGASGGFRFFPTSRLGIDMNVGWYRGTIGSSASGGSTFVVSPSLLFMLSKPRPQADIDLRPYVGGGVNYSYRTTGTPTRNAAPVATLQESGWGGQVFGGAEMTFKEAKAVAISFEIAHYESAASTGFLGGHARGTDFYLMFHFYVN